MNGDISNINEGLGMVAVAKEYEKNHQYYQAGNEYYALAAFFKQINEKKLQAQCQIAHAVNMIKYYLEERDIEKFSFNVYDIYIEEVEGIKSLELSEIDKYDILISTYRELEKVFRDLNIIDRENEMYYKRMELYHKLYWQKVWQQDLKYNERLKYFSQCIFRGILHYFYRHGKKPVRALLLIFIPIIFFAILYKVFNLIEFTDPQKTLCFWQSLYFSVVTYTTLGYGDIVPTCLIGQLLTIFEVFLGVLTITLFIPLIIKKLE